ncbi:MAG: helix-turn-helix domain-containing protein [Clostridium sp.]|jgi:transcriptional regulator with XRE-family HTH domain|uniref:helix-turn-helix domain-containing protein n=1 Tax=Clostridium sp. TaxID=1506 RepID=UPI0025BD8AFB|nr:helix-turn-helix transcriptional regulator [Clostridium sp.]MCH3962946.1 helix-turn-helix domain-containing protein [Clostridium sp.]MCI1800156.1 helix-turn-helix domain-containing protein [Clostridium sp.]MCI2200151.1 helix-turn-helix domain-containing protein [Clostridium sp.]
MENNILGNRIKRLREEKTISQLEMAKILNISNTTLSQYESGKRIPSDSIKKKIAEYFNVSLDYLLGLTDSKTNSNTNIDKEDFEFKTPQEAMEFILKQPAIAGYGGFEPEKMGDEEIMDFANELLHQLKLLGYKYKK